MPCAGVVQGLSWVDRLLVVWILGAMVVGVVCGKFAPVLRDRFAVAELYGTPLPIAVGLWLMMWPVLSKVRGFRVHDFRFRVFKTDTRRVGALLRSALPWPSSTARLCPSRSASGS